MQAARTAQQAQTILQDRFAEVADLARQLHRLVGAGPLVGCVQRDLLSSADYFAFALRDLADRLRGTLPSQALEEFPDVWLHLEPVAGPVPTTIRLRKALKTLLRAFGFRCTNIRPGRRAEREDRP